MVVPPPTRFGVDTLGTLFGPSKLLTSSLSNLILGVVSGVALSVLLMQSLTNSLCFLVIVSLIHRPVFTRSVQHKFPRISNSAPLRLCRETRVIFGCNRVVAGAKIFVMLDNAGCQGICAIWFCDIFLASLAALCSRNKFFASLCIRDVLREVVLSLSRSSESIKHQTDLCLICDFCCLKVANMFRKYSVQCLSSSMSKQLWHCTLEVISHISECSVFPMLRIMSFDFSPNGLTA